MILSVAIMAHPRRRRQAELLAAQTGGYIVWDTKNDEWDTGSRALAAHNPGASHHIVLQDDAMPIPKFLGHAAAAIEQHPDRLISFYLGTWKPLEWQAAVDDATEDADRLGLSWLMCDRLLHGVAIALPVADIEPLLEWCQRPEVPYDERIGIWYRYVAERPALFTWPSLVDHADTDTIAEHPDGEARDQPRRARRVGVPATWKTEVIPI